MVGNKRDKVLEGRIHEIKLISLVLLYQII